MLKQPLWRVHGGTRLAIVVVLLLLASGAGGIWFATRTTPVGVRLHEVGRGAVRSIVANTRVGTVEACVRAKMSPSAAGRVAKIDVQPGDRVSAGTALLEIWNEDLKSQVRLAEAEIATARARADEACAASAGAEREAERLRRMRERKLISEEDADAATTTAESKIAACRAAIATTRVRVVQLDVRRQQLEETVLRAPFDGVVAEVDAKLGEYLTPSPPGIATLPAIDLIAAGCVYVSAPIDEVDAPAVATGMQVCVTLDAFKGKRCAARVRRIADYVQEAEKQARTIEVEVEFTDPNDALLLVPGYSADIEILIKEVAGVIRVPTEALLEGTSVLIFDRDTKMLSTRAVSAGIADWEFTEITDGLVVGESVVLSTGRPGVAAGVSAVVEDDG